MPFHIRNGTITTLQGTTWMSAPDPYRTANAVPCSPSRSTQGEEAAFDDSPPGEAAYVPPGQPSGTSAPATGLGYPSQGGDAGKTRTPQHHTPTDRTTTTAGGPNRIKPGQTPQGASGRLAAFRTMTARETAL